MIREYLFRGMQKDNYEWVEGNLRKDPDLETYYINGWKYYTNENGLQREPFEYEVIPKTVGQYTGFDINNVKLFVGDILARSHKELIKHSILMVIKFDENKGSFVASDINGGNYTFISDYLDNKYKLNIVDTIFNKDGTVKDIQYI